MEMHGHLVDGTPMRPKYDRVHCAQWLRIFAPRIKAKAFNLYLSCKQQIFRKKEFKD